MLRDTKDVCNVICDVMRVAWLSEHNKHFTVQSANKNIAKRKSKQETHSKSRRVAARSISADRYTTRKPANACVREQHNTEAGKKRPREKPLKKQSSGCLLEAARSSCAISGTDGSIADCTTRLLLIRCRRRFELNRQARGFSDVDRAELSSARLRRFLAAADEAPPPFWAIDGADMSSVRLRHVSDRSVEQSAEPSCQARGCDAELHTVRSRTEKFFDLWKTILPKLVVELDTEQKQNRKAVESLGLPFLSKTAGQQKNGNKQKKGMP
jgi:hypothetical protein